jgi:hypothetical protein
MTSLSRLNYARSPGAVAFTVCSFAVGTTAALRWVSKPYIWRIYQLQSSGGAVQSAAAQVAAAQQASVSAAASQAMRKASAGAGAAAYSAPLVLEHFNLLGKVIQTELRNGLDDVAPAQDRVFMNLGLKGHESLYVHEEPDCYASDDFYLEVLKRANIIPGAKKKR